MLGYLLGSNLATDIPIYVLALVIGVYQIFHASINLVTYVLYRKNNIRPRFRLLLDGILLVFLGGASLLSSTGNSVFQLFVLGAYFSFMVCPISVTVSYLKGKLGKTISNVA